jgi:hypothetical protein
MSAAIFLRKARKRAESAFKSASFAALIAHTSDAKAFGAPKIAFGIGLCPNLIAAAGFGQAPSEEVGMGELASQVLFIKRTA